MRILIDVLQIAVVDFFNKFVQQGVAQPNLDVFNPIGGSDADL